MTASERLTLIPGCWYAWTMWPGYVDQAYHSPIRVEAVEPLKTGSGRFDLTFLNANYVSGMQNMTYELRMLKRDAHYILATVEKSDRAVCLEQINLQWLARHMREEDLPFNMFRRHADIATELIADWLDYQHRR